MADRGRNTNVKIVWSSSLRSLDHLFERIEADYQSDSTKSHDCKEDSVSPAPSSSGCSSTYSLHFDSSRSLPSSPVSESEGSSIDYSPIIRQAKVNLYTDYYTYAEAKKRYFAYR